MTFFLLMIILAGRKFGYKKLNLKPFSNFKDWYFYFHIRAYYGTNKYEQLKSIDAFNIVENKYKRSVLRDV